MKSMPAKQSPQTSPWFEMRARQAMHTGGNRRSAAAPSADRQAGALCRNSISLTPMVLMIQSEIAFLEDPRGAIS